MRILVTGADGFVGSWLVPRLRRDRHEVVAAIRPSQPIIAEGAPPPWDGDVTTVPFEVLDDRSVEAVLAPGYDAVVHLAAVASGGDARRDPADAWAINVGGTARLAEQLGRQKVAGRADPLMLFISSIEVYGAAPPPPRRESDPTEPVSPYAASKLAAETSVLEVHRRTGLRVAIARPSGHTGRGQDDRFVVPAFTRRLLEAKRNGDHSVKVGNLTPVREFLHVSDVVEAYASLLASGQPGEIYNVASGRPVKLSELFCMLADVVGHSAEPEEDPDLVRPADIPYLVGDASKLSEAVGWQPTVSLEDTLAEVVNAQAH